MGAGRGAKEIGESGNLLMDVVVVRRCDAGKRAHAEAFSAKLAD